MKSRRLLGWGCLVLIAVMPFHAFLTVWAGSVFGRQELWQAWKEVFISLMTIPAGLMLARRRKFSTLGWLIASYAAFSLLFVLAAPNHPFAELLAIKANLVFLVVFMLATLVKDKDFKRLGQNLLLGTSAIASGFAIIQNTLLPENFLERFGYGASTVPPYLPYNDLLRFPSTLGGPNQLGAFLILPIALTLRLCLKQGKIWQWGLLAIQLSALIFTYSRSAWLGAVVAIAIVAWVEIPKRWRFTVLSTGLLGLAIAAGLILNSSYRQVLVRGGLEANTSDANRVESLSTGAETLLKHPLGLGPGSAGPASFEDEEPLIPENYYLQLGIEVGLVGLGLFLGIQILLAKALWRQKSDLSGPLVAALAGIAIVNLFLHGWADSTTALTYWALAGLSYGGEADV